MNSPFVMVIFGATGDLARNKLFPALFSLYQHNQLGEKFFIIGFARKEMLDDEFRDIVANNITGDKKKIHAFIKNFSYQQGFFEERKGYEVLMTAFAAFETKIRTCSFRFFYLATPPDNYDTIIHMLKKTKLSEGCSAHFTGAEGRGKTKVIVEKPFGKDLDTARHLDNKLSKIFEEEQIFRVDHYLGKETVQNILAFRFANGIFEPVWNNTYIDHVQITWGETKGVENRENFFDGVGMLRDVAQNHLLQLLASIAMEQPKSFSKEGVRDARAAAIHAIVPIEPTDVKKYVVAGQYKGYTKEKGVDSQTLTETFVAMKLFVDTKRFSGVPFYVRAGKKMPKNIVEISIVFIQTCHILFKEYGCPEIGNILTIRIQPDEGIALRVIAKKPGVKLSLRTVDMKFSYEQDFGRKGAEAYEKVLLDIFAGDQMLFNRSDELESSWEFITNILQGWKSRESRVKRYEEGTWGPKEANDMIEKDGRKWL